MDWHFPEVFKLIPGAFGSLFSMLFIKGSVPRLVFMFLGGSIAAYYATPYTAKVTGFDVGISGFLLGLFSMSLISSLFEGWKKLDLSAIVKETLRHYLRLPPEQKNDSTKL